MKDLLKAPRLPARASVGLLLLRLFVGVAFMQHGWGKIQNPFGWMGPESTMPGILLALAALSEFGGGLALALGLLTLPASFGLACTMAVAAYFHLVKFGDPLIAKGPGGSAEPAVTYLCVAVLLLLAGPGRYSADAKVFGEQA